MQNKMGEHGLIDMEDKNVLVGGEHFESFRDGGT